jgi:hypothetical protein
MRCPPIKRGGAHKAQRGSWLREKVTQMAGRPPNPTNLQAINGAFKKNPKRARAREGEPRPTGPLGPAPQRWEPHPQAFHASALFADGKSTSDVAVILQIDWGTAKTLRDQTSASDNAQLVRLWDEVAIMAPWLTFADRWTVESVCELKLRERKGPILIGERAELGRLCGKCGMNPSDRTRVNTFPSAPRKSEEADPRDAYMRRKSKAG